MKFPLLRRDVAVGLSLGAAGIAIIAVASVLAVRDADRKAESLAELSAAEAVAEFEQTVDKILDHVGSSIVRELGTMKEFSFDETVALARARDLDELNIVDAKGVIASSSDPDLDGRHPDMKDSPKSREFVERLVGKGERALSQRFRHGVHNPDRVRKYLGVRFPDGSGFVQLGYDERRFATDFDVRFADIYDAKPIGESGFYVCARVDDERIVSRPAGYAEFLGAKLADAGLVAGDFGEDCVRAEVFGETCRVRRCIYGRHYVFACVPEREFRHQALKTSFIVGGLLLPVLALFTALVLRLVDSARRIELLRVAEERRQANDLAMARSIQMSSMPVIFPPFPNCLEIGLFAGMETAREVGGDFYDYYFVGPGRLAVVVADVSGKGIPAAMFMMRARTTIKSCIISKGDLSEAVEEANRILSAGNDASMFVTAWIGVLDVRTGRLEYVNAGHNPPFVRHADDSVEALRKVSGIFLAAFDRTRYARFEVDLGKGDVLFLYTDGVTEAATRDGRMFGESRLEATLGIAPRAPKALYCAVREEVKNFCAGAPLFDDITMLALALRGAPLTDEFETTADREGLVAAKAFVEKQLEKCSAPADLASAFGIAVDEIVNNIVSYSGSRDMRLVFEHAGYPEELRLTFSDSGTPWNPLEHADPDVSAPLKDRPIGGLGIMLVKKLMDGVAYERRDGRNVFSVRRRFDSSKA